MRLLVFIALIVSIQGLAQDGDKLYHGFKFNVYISNGFYDINKIEYANYKSNGFQLSYGASVSYFPTKRIGIRLISGYTRDDFYFQNYIAGANYWEEPTMTKSMAYFDLGAQVQYNILTHEKFQIGISGGFITGHLVKGENVLVGIYGPDYPYYFRGPSKQFSKKVPGSAISVIFSYHLIKQMAIEVEPMWRHFFKDIATNEANSTPIINLLISLSYRINYH